MLKISVPFREEEEVNALIDAGADELYCGYLPPSWERIYTDLEFERKGGRKSNFTELGVLKKAVHTAHNRNVPVYLTLNGLYVNSQYPLLNKIIDQLEGIAFDSFIVADLGLLLLLRKRRLKSKIHISTGGTVFNSRSVDFYKGLGASRIVLDRQVSIDSMKNITSAHPEIEFEAFIINTLCVYIDGFCTFTHMYNLYTDEKQKRIPKDTKEKKMLLSIASSYDIDSRADACCLKYDVKTIDLDKSDIIVDKKIKPVFFKQLTDGRECGACAIYDIALTGVKSLKIVGRQLAPELRLSDTRFIRACLDILKDNKKIKKDKFIQLAQDNYKDYCGYKDKCRGNNCYHPGVIL
jgi:putative protease